ncbi:hypothetical protein QTP86_034314, partial [Hemibagrus guttatus]
MTHPSHTSQTPLTHSSPSCCLE